MKSMNIPKVKGKLTLIERKKVRAFIRDKQGNGKMAEQITGVSIPTLRKAILGEEVLACKIESIKLLLN